MVSPWPQLQRTRGLAPLAHCQEVRLGGEGARHRRLSDAQTLGEARALAQTALDLWALTREPAQLERCLAALTVPTTLALPPQLGAGQRCGAWRC